MRFKSIYNGMPKMSSWGCKALNWRFVIGYDHKFEDGYTASYMTINNDEMNWLGDKIHPKMKLPHFETFAEAEKACRDKFVELRSLM